MGAVGIANDVQVFGGENTHDRNLHEAIECTRKADIRLNFNKYIIKTKCCSFIFFFLKPLHSKRSQASSKEGRSHQTDVVTHKQTTAKFLPRYGNLLISVYAKYFLLDFRC